MAKPYDHSLHSAKRYGGKPEDYQKIHDWFDQTKAAHPTLKHRAILHNSFGIYLAEQMFGTTLTNSDGKVISVRSIGEQHVIDDLGFIPSLDEWLKAMTDEPWMYGQRTRKFVLVD